MSQTTSPPLQPRRRARIRNALVAVVALAVVGLLAWWGWSAWSQMRMALAVEANNRGVGYMEYFEEAVPGESVMGYVKAGREFEEAVRLTPHWQAARINLGIALLNSGNKNPADLDRATAVFKDILDEEPRNPYANYCLGLLHQYRNTGESATYFRIVTEVDPNDAFAWAMLAKSTFNDFNAQRQYYQKAVELRPTLRVAVFNLQQVYGQLAAEAEVANKPDEAKKLESERQKLLDEFDALLQAEWFTPWDMKYTEMGKYATVIDTRPPGVPPPPFGPLPLFLPEKKFEVRLAPGARWARAEDFGTDPVGELRRAVRERFGATIVVLDYDRDGKPDLFLIGAVVENGQVRDLLLHNEGDGKFKDVTTEAGLATPHPTLGCSVADFDNDTYPDLLLTGAGSQRLFRNNRKGGFEDVTQLAGFDKLTSVCLGAIFADLDQDGDLDLLIAEYAATPEDALKVLKGDKSEKGGVVVYLNVGEAPPVPPSENRPPLSCKWKWADNLKALHGDSGPVVALATSDFDGDNDLDFLVLTDRASPAVVVNDRLLRFRRMALATDTAGELPWNGALVLDVDQDGRSDVLLLGVGQTPRLLMNRSEAQKKDPKTWFEPGIIKSPPLLEAQAVDVDLDGWPDVVGLSDKHIPVLLHNQGGKLVERPHAFGLDDSWPSDLVAVRAVCPKIGPPVSKTTECNAFPDLLVWSESQGLLLYSNQGNPNHGLLVELNGQIKVFQLPSRCNADGVGAWVIVVAGELRSGVENGTLSAGLGQSQQPLVLGMGRHTNAEAVRLRWPDNVFQAELNKPLSPNVPPSPVRRPDNVFQAELNPTCGPKRIVENNRKGTSCPVLFAWNGTCFEFVTDFLGAGSMGELEADGGTRPPRPEESVKIEPRQLALKDGHYVLHIAEPMDEVTYLDRLQLVAIDHPAGVRVYPDERFVAEGPQPSQDLIAFDREVFPISAHDHKGRDVTETLRAWDRKTVDGFAKRSWLGFAEEHFVELDFGDRLKDIKADERVFLCLAGWTDYPYPESIYAAEQAGVPMLPPVLERRNKDGKWVKVAEAGFPAGLPRMMLLDVTGELLGPDCGLRLRTNLQIYWDQVFVALGCHTIVPDKAADLSGRAACLEVGDAKLQPCGLLKEVSPDGKLPTIFDHDRTETALFAGLSGNLTRYGDVTELLRQRDDRFVIFGADDLLTVRFDAQKLPPLPDGWQRSFVLRTWGYCKDTSIFTAHGSTIGPLPFHAMKTYPYRADEKFPDDEAHREYQRRYNTRPVRAESFPVRCK